MLFKVLWNIFLWKQGNTILVDTPGIGGSGEVTNKLMDYLPNAVSFVFVINVVSAGGMQRDRVNIYCLPKLYMYQTVFIWIFFLSDVKCALILIMQYFPSEIITFYNGNQMGFITKNSLWK